jgi:hypothetical protein
VVGYTPCHRKKQPPPPLLLKIMGLEEVDEDKGTRMGHLNSSWVWLDRISKK